MADRAEFFGDFDDDRPGDEQERSSEEWEEEQPLEEQLLALAPDMQVLSVMVSGFDQNDVEKLAEAIQDAVHSMEAAGTPGRQPRSFFGIVHRHY